MPNNSPLHGRLLTTEKPLANGSSFLWYFHQFGMKTLLANPGPYHIPRPPQESYGQALRDALASTRSARFSGLVG